MVISNKVVSTDVLSPDELAILTGKKYHGAQIRELNHMGISHRTRVDGSVVVVRADLPMDKPASHRSARLVINV
jgi:hypothetical protein